MSEPKFGKPVRIGVMKQVVENGRYVSKFVIEDFNPQDNFKDYGLFDLSMDHLKAIGADLQDCGTSNPGDFNAIDSLSAKIADYEMELDKNIEEDK